MLIICCVDVARNAYSVRVRNLLTSGRFSDFAFICADSRVRAHRHVLDIHSNIIRNLNSSEILVPFNRASVRLLLQLLYSQFVPLRNVQLNTMVVLLNSFQVFGTCIPGREIVNFDHNTFDCVIVLGNDPELIQLIQHTFQYHQRELEIILAEENIPNVEQENGHGLCQVSQNVSRAGPSGVSRAGPSGESRAGPSGVRHRANHPGNSNYPCPLITNESAIMRNVIHAAPFPNILMQNGHIAARSNYFATNLQRLPSSQIPHITVASGHDIINRPSTSNSVNCYAQFSDAARTYQPCAAGNVQQLERTALLPTSTSMNNIACVVAEYPRRVQRTIVTESTRADPTVGGVSSNCQTRSNPSCKGTSQNASKFSASNLSKQSQNSPYIAKTSNQATCIRSEAEHNVMENQQSIAQPTRTMSEVDLLPSTSQSKTLNQSTRRNGIGDIPTVNSIGQNPSCSYAVNADTRLKCTRENVTKKSSGRGLHSVTPAANANKVSVGARVQTIAEQTNFDSDDDVVFVSHTNPIRTIITVHDSDSEDDSENTTGRKINRGSTPNLYTRKREPKGPVSAKELRRRLATIKKEKTSGENNPDVSIAMSTITTANQVEECVAETSSAAECARKSKRIQKKEPEEEQEKDTKSNRKSRRINEREPQEEQETDKRGKGRKFVKGRKSNKN